MFLHQHCDKREKAKKNIRKGIKRSSALDIREPMKILNSILREIYRPIRGRNSTNTLLASGGNENFRLHMCTPSDNLCENVTLQDSNWTPSGQQ
ncbi:hypothetical protein TNIN_352581 [Trichonephila inaurata madagascariensis]|uniref:Uncharacterized protein n=1 Tax=Trichonephila inaurata madagascariensis TaxID=2747483 RepID=A0A8X6XKW1_9ARAC|nr:hypothetical protein TNIN_352581 [Trichonephila inaurata madagascariensis]